MTDRGGRRRADSAATRIDRRDQEQALLTLPERALTSFQLFFANRLCMLEILKRLSADARAATAIEYGLVAALIAVTAIAAIQGLGNEVKKPFSNVSTNMKAS